MKKIFTITISIILVSLIGLGVIGYYVEKDKANNKKEDIKKALDKKTENGELYCEALRANFK